MQCRARPSQSVPPPLFRLAPGPWPLAPLLFELASSGAEAFRIPICHLAKCAHVDLVSACDIIPNRAKAQADKFQIPNHYPHIDKMLAGAAFDLLVNLTDMQVHERLNGQEIAAGRHVWSEKPLANLIAAGERLIEVSIQKDVRFWGAPAMVVSPQFAFMARTLATANSADWRPPTPTMDTPDPIGRRASTK